MLVINPETFEKHMKFLIKYYEPISLSELASRINSKSIQGNEICITFDDGYKDNLTNAIPILKKYNIPATIFITTANIGKQANHDWDIKYKENERAYFLSEDEIIECSKNPLVEIGAHTHTHKRLSDLTFNEQITEIETSKKILEKVTCNKIMHFAYPFGSKLDFNKNSVKIVKNLGFISAYENTGLLGTNNSNIYSFPRINIRECPVEKISRQLYNSK
jgi:peptidoglycan/xylan/chitin deacetylase (PgdA/CDA1 family)